MSNEAKFTKGPWKCHVNTARMVEVVIGDDEYPGWRGDEYLCVSVGQTGRMNNDHNGYLMAAAPAMHDALISVLNLGVDEVQRQIIESALTEARGEHDIN